MEKLTKDELSIIYYDLLENVIYEHIFHSHIKSGKGIPFNPFRKGKYMFIEFRHGPHLRDDVGYILYGLMCKCIYFEVKRNNGYLCVVVNLEKYYKEHPYIYHFRWNG